MILTVDPALGQALLTSGTFLLVAIVGFILNRKSRQIKVLVNGRLDEALKENKDLRNRVDHLEHALEGRYEGVRRDYEALVPGKRKP